MSKNQENIIMSKTNVVNQDYNKIFNLWRLEEFFTPLDYPELIETVKENGKKVPFDAYFNEYNSRKLPLQNYINHNQYLLGKKVKEEQLYNRANIYCGCYKLNKFICKMAEICGLDMDKYIDLYELGGKFYIFSVQIDLEGNVTEEGVKVSPFFYSIINMMKAKKIDIAISEQRLFELNADINEILQQNAISILEFKDVDIVTSIVFNKMGIDSSQNIGLESASKKMFACKGLQRMDETEDFQSFYLREIDLVHRNYKKNQHVAQYISTLISSETERVMIDEDIEEMQKWLEVDRYPLAKYPSKFSPTLMQQIAINIAVSEKDRKQKIFSVNGPPGTGKTTLLKEIIASNVEKQAEVLIRYGIGEKAFRVHKIESTSTPTYDDMYYEIPDEITKYGILVVSNNNGAVENITLELPQAKEVISDKTRTEWFDRNTSEEIYFSRVADELLGDENSAWGLVSARMGRRKYVSEVLNACVFKRCNDDEEKITLNSAEEFSMSWDDAKSNFQKAKNEVLKIRRQIKKDKETLQHMYAEEETLAHQQAVYKEIEREKENFVKDAEEAETVLRRNEKDTVVCREEIAYIKKNASMIGKILILLHIGVLGKRVCEKQCQYNELILEHEKLRSEHDFLVGKIMDINEKIGRQEVKIVESEKRLDDFKQLVYGKENSLKIKYGTNLGDKQFYQDIKSSEESQNACPWTYPDYDKARENLFYAALQVRKAFVLKSKIIRRNLFVYESYMRGSLNATERAEIFPHIFNSLSVVIPVLSSTFASVGRFLKDAGNQSLGMLIIDESGQATPQSAIGALYRTKQAVVVGDPLQVEPVVTIPQIIIDMLVDSTGVAKPYGRTDISVQSFADNVNQFCGMIGEQQVGCPLVVHRRCIEPMFSISNMISYDNRMFNKTKDKEEYLDIEKPFLIKKSGWIDVKGSEVGKSNHFVEEQAKKVCELLEQSMEIYDDIFRDYKKIFIISPFRTVSDSMRTYIIDYFVSKGIDKGDMKDWVKKCVGTVHTFQGKDANEVLFVLGCSSNSIGAMNWVTAKANILNVACTRAKYRIAFIGNIDDWKKRKYFKDFIPKMIDKL